MLGLFFLFVSFCFVVGKVRISKLRLRNRLQSCFRSEAWELQACSLNFLCALVCGFWSHHLAFPTQSSHELCTTASRRYPGVREPHPRPAGSLGTGRMTGTHRCTDSTGSASVSEHNSWPFHSSPNRDPSQVGAAGLWLPFALLCLFVGSPAWPRGGLGEPSPGPDLPPRLVTAGEGFKCCGHVSKSFGDWGGRAIAAAARSQKWSGFSTDGLGMRPCCCVAVTFGWGRQMSWEEEKVMM